MKRFVHRFTQRRLGRTVVARIVAACALIGLPLMAATAAPGPSAAALAARFGLVSQTPYSVAADGTVALVLALPSSVDLAVLPDADLVVTAYRAVTTRAEVEQARLGELPRSVDTVDFPLASLARPEAGQIAATVTLETDTRTAESLQLAKAGLYPVLIELQDKGNVLAELLTFVRRLPTAAEVPEVALPVAMAMATTSPVVIDDNDEVVVDEAVLAEFGRLADLLEASSMPVAVRVPPALLIAIGQHGSDGAALAARLAAGLAKNEVLSSPRLPLDPSLAAAAGQQGLYTQWLRDGEDDLAAAISNPSQRTIVFMNGPLSDAGGALLRDLGARLTVTTPKIFDALPESTGIYTDFSLLVHLEVADGARMDAAVTDRDMGPLLERRTAAPTLTGIYAVTSLLAYRQEIVDAEGDPARHGVTLGTTDLSLPQIDTYRAITTLLTDTPGLQPITVDTLGIRTNHLVLPNFGEVTAGLPDTVDGNLSNRIDVVDSLTSAALSTASMLPVDDVRTAQWQATISRLPTSALTDDQVDRLATDLRGQFQAVRSSITLPASFSFNLTGRSTTVPIKLYNSSDVPLTVLVRMSSSKLVEGNRDKLAVLPPLSFQEVPIKIEARTNGEFQVTLQVLTPAGDELAPAVPLFANVNALSGLGNLVTGALLLVVLTWWVRHLRLNRRNRAASRAADRHPVNNGRALTTETDAADDVDLDDVDGVDDADDSIDTERNIGGESESESDHDGVDEDGDDGIDGGTALSPDAATSTLPPS